MWSMLNTADLHCGSVLVSNPVIAKHLYSKTPAFVTLFPVMVLLHTLYTHSQPCYELSVKVNLAAATAVLPYP